MLPAAGRQRVRGRTRGGAGRVEGRVEGAEWQWLGGAKERWERGARH